MASAVASSVFTASALDTEELAARDEIHRGTFSSCARRSMVARATSRLEPMVMLGICEAFSARCNLSQLTPSNFAASGTDKNKVV
jgi:hypothetical protein